MGILDQIISAESGGDPNAQNSRSSAGGAGQFIDSTWLEMLAKHRPDLTGSESDLLALKKDPALSRDMTAAYAADNGKLLSSAGVNVTPGTTYLAHFAGPHGAIGLLHADPSAPAASILGQGFAKANPSMAGWTAGQVASWADRKMGGPGAAPLASAPAAAAGAPMAIAPPPPQQPPRAAQAPMSFGGPSAAPSAALTAVPQIANILPQRQIFAIGKPAPFSFGGRTT